MRIFTKILSIMFLCVMCGIFFIGCTLSSPENSEFKLTDFTKISEAEYEITLPLSNASINISKHIRSTSEQTWSLYEDKECLNLCESNILELEQGENFFYILLVDGEKAPEVYSLNIIRGRTYTVSIQTNGGPQILSEISALEGTPLYELDYYNKDYAYVLDENSVVFDGWYTNSTLKAKLPENFKINKNLVAYLNFEPIKPDFQSSINRTTNKSPKSVDAIDAFLTAEQNLINSNQYKILCSGESHSIGIKQDINALTEYKSNKRYTEIAATSIVSSQIKIQANKTTDNVFVFENNNSTPSELTQKEYKQNYGLAAFAPLQYIISKATVISKTSVSQKSTNLFCFELDLNAYSFINYQKFLEQFYDNTFSQFTSCKLKCFFDKDYNFTSIEISETFSAISSIVGIHQVQTFLTYNFNYTDFNFDKF